MKLSLSFHFNQRNQRVTLTQAIQVLGTKFMQMKMRWTTGFKINKFFARVYWILPKYEHTTLYYEVAKKKHFPLAWMAVQVPIAFWSAGENRIVRYCFIYRMYVSDLFWISKLIIDVENTSELHGIMLSF